MQDGSAGILFQKKEEDKEKKEEKKREDKRKEKRRKMRRKRSSIEENEGDLCQQSVIT